MADHECLVVMALLPWLPPPTPPVNQKDGSSTSVEKSSRAPRKTLEKKEARAVAGWVFLAALQVEASARF